MADNFIKVEIGAFLYNAGLVGLHYMLRNMEAEEGVDYQIEGNALFVSESFLLEQDLAQAYIEAHIEKFADDAAFTRILNEVENIERLTEKFCADESAKNKKALNDVYKWVLENTGLLRASYVSGLESLAAPFELKERCQEIKKIADYKDKLVSLRKLRDELVQDPYKKMFLMKDVIYSRINAVWENKAFLNRANAKKDISTVYTNDFIQPLKNYLALDKGTLKIKNPKVCIECDAILPSNMDKDISFVQGATEDMARKKSSFWNFKPDVYVCPVCAFIYSLSPLGFQPLGKNLVFVNSNTNFDNLVSINDGVGSIHQIEIKGKENELYQRILNSVTQEVINGKLKEQKNIQVIVRDKNVPTYKFNVIAKDILAVLEASKSNLTKMINISIEISPKVWLWVYQEVIERIFQRLNQYDLLNRLLKHSLKDNTPTIYLWHVIRIQINIRGGLEVERKNADNAFYRGRELREFIGALRGGNEDADNKLRGFVYQLLNALQARNNEKFWHLILKMYSGYSKPVPKIFLETFSSEEELQFLGYAFILGLKNEKYIEENKPEEAAK